ncbi:MAG: hypothetical protein LC798_03115 [Chloroflexi bacterium]|nr:hypothetical protein [Chloroflexota bacterium]
MPFAPLAVVEDLATYLRRDLSAADLASAELFLDIASDTVRSACGRQVLSLIEDDTYLRRTARTVLELPQRPVRDVSTISVNGSALAADAWEWDGDETAALVGPLPVGNASSWWPRGSRLVSVTYDHGYPAAEMPWDIKGTVLDLAARAMSAPPGVTQRSLGSFSESFGRQIASTLTEEEKAKLRPYRRGQATLTAGLGR